MKNIGLLKQFAPKAPKSLHKGINAVIYTRVSSAEQEDNTSLNSQKKQCEKHAEKKGLNVIGYFGGTYESAKTDDRKEFNKMLNFVKRSKDISYIIVYSYERFSRSGISGANIANDLLKKYGIITIAVSQELDPTTPAGSFQQNILFLFGQMDNEMRRDKSVAGMKEMLLKGYWIWEVPRGYMDLNKGARASERQLVVNKEGKLLKKAFEWKAYKKMSNADINRKLNKMGVKIDERRLNNLFSNPFYCGVITSKMIPDQVIDGHHEAMITPELFLTVNDIRTEARPLSYVMKEESDNLPLKVFTKCSKCETGMTGYLVRKKGLYYYKCRKKGCKNNRSAKFIHETFKNILLAFHVKKEEKDIVQVQLEEQFNNFFKTNINLKKSLESTLSETQHKLEKIDERFAIGEIDKEMYEKFKVKYSKEKSGINKELSKTTLNSSNLSKVIEYAIKICLKPLLLWENSDLDSQRVLQDMLFPEGIYYNREKDRVRTFRINSFFQSIPDIIGDLAGKKKGDFVLFNEIPLVG